MNVPRTRSSRPGLRAVVPLQKDESGSSLVELALLFPLLLLLLVGAVDLGRAFYVAIEVSSAASAGALYGTQNPTDTTGMQHAAALNAPDLTGIVSVASYGCECSDGTSASASCSTTPTCSQDVIQYVQVTTSFTYVPVVRYPGVPSSFALHGKARLRAGQ